MKLFDKALKYRGNILKKVIRNQTKKREEIVVKNGEGPGGDPPPEKRRLIGGVNVVFLRKLK